MARNLAALFPRRSPAERAAETLVALGVPRGTIRLVEHDPSTIALLATVDDEVAAEAIRAIEREHPRSVDSGQREQVRVRSWPAAHPMEPMHGHTQRELGEQSIEPADTDERRTHFADWERDWRLHYDEHPWGRRLSFREVQPAYHLGMHLAEDPSWRDRRWAEVEPHAMELWEAEHGNEGTWELVRDAVEYAWRRYDVVV